MIRRPATILLDANIWIAERMLHSPLGAAVLYAAVETGTRFALPEIVEQEVTSVLLNEFDRTVDGFEKSARWLRGFTSLQVSITAPSRSAAEAAFQQRWSQLAGILDRVPLALDHVRGAVGKILEKLPPCGPNNEQFRDACIWQCAVEMAQAQTVHLITADRAFYEGRSSANGLATNLLQEVQAIDGELLLHRSLDEFLTSSGTSARPVDEEVIKVAIIALIRPKAGDVAEIQNLQLGPHKRIDISGYATPTGSLLAVSFNVTFEATRISGRAGEPDLKAGITMRGSLSWNPVSRQAFDLEPSGWSVHVDEPQGGSHGSAWDYGFSNQFREGQFQLI